MTKGWRPRSAMVLAAGLGTRMRPLTDALPKPLVPLKGRALIDHVLDRIAEADISRAVVNVHYLADKIQAHLRTRTRPEIVISDERDALLDTGGGVVRALPLLGPEPFLIHNSDSVWIEKGTSNIARLADHWDTIRMDGLLLLARRASSLGYEGRGDFELHADGRVSRRPRERESDYVFTGVSIADSRLFRGAPADRFSLNEPLNSAIASGRLFGLVLEGSWMHIGTADSLADAAKQIDLENAAG